MSTTQSLRSALTSGLFRSSLYRRMALDGPVPSEVRLKFPWHAPGDRTQADAIIGEEFLFFGRRIPFGAIPWSVLPAGAALAEALHGFTWLADLSATGTEAARLRARALVMGWIMTHRRWSLPAWSPAVLADRLTSWLATAEFILEGASGDERARFLESAGLQARHLRRAIGETSGTDAAFAAVRGDIAAALCLGIIPLAPALDRLDREIGRQIAADGGHPRRNPRVLLRIFRNLVDIRSALAEAREEAPPALQTAIERMAPMLRMLRHGDGRLALFHGAKESDRTLIDSLLAASKVGTPAQPSALETGYERMVAGRTLVLVDVGSPPAGGHLAPLAFEMSLGRERMIVNCGDYGGDDPRWHAALRSTPAHSTLVVEDASADDAGWLPRRPARVASLRQETEGAVWLDGSHEGYRRRFGVIHHRRLYLADGGTDLRGEDTLAGRRHCGYRLRFHLHPDIVAKPADDGTSVQLRTASGSLWRFLAVGGAIGLEDSTYLGSTDQPRKSSQITVSGTTLNGNARIKWALRQDGGGAGAVTVG
ncbi:MAG: heparinase II/III family protein [Rhodospirillales bacterium]